ncbi:unnamed protein product [Diamesa hyperborea]
MGSSELVNCLKIAREELREDETRKAQALVQFREWISKHPAFKNYRTDDSFFLQFLRARKFNNSQAHELYENYFINVRQHPKWHADDEKKNQKVMQMFDRGVYYPLSQRDAEGRKIIYNNVSKLDPSIDTPESHFSTIFEVYTQLIEDEITQITGLVVISDCTGFTSKHLSCVSIPDIVVLANCLKNAMTARIKCIYILNLPPFARILLDVFKIALSDKLKKRLVVVKDMEEFKSKYFDAKLLPKEFGGITPEADMIKEFQETMKQNQKKRQQIYDTEFNINMIPGKKNEEIGTGSFRKLEID